MSDVKLYQKSALSLGVGDVIYVSRPDGSSDGSATLTAVSAIVHAVNGALYATAGHAHAYGHLTGLPTLGDLAALDTITASLVSDFNTAADARIAAAVGVTVEGYDADTARIDQAQTWTAKPTFSAGADLTPAAAPSTTSVGYLGAPQISDQDDYTLTMADAGKHYYHTSPSTHTLTIPANASVAFPIGTVIAIVNENGGGDLSIAVVDDTLRWTDQTGARTLAANGTATLLKVDDAVWRLTGDGIT